MYLDQNGGLQQIGPSFYPQIPSVINPTPMYMDDSIRANQAEFVAPMSNANTYVREENINLKKIKINREYFTLRAGVLRLVLIISLIGGWIAAAAGPRNAFFNSIFGFQSTRIAYLTFSLICFFLSIFIFAINFLSITNLNKLERVPWTKIYLGLDVFFFITMLSVSIAAAVRESQIARFAAYGYYNVGSFGAAAFFGFLSCVILIVIIVFWIMKLNQEARLEKVNEKDLNQVVYNSELRPTQYENEVIGVNTIGSLRRGSPAGVTSFYATPPGMMQQPQTFVTNVIESEVSEVI